MSRQNTRENYMRKLKHIISLNTFIGSVNEAFAATDFERANQIICDYLWKHLGKLYVYPDVERFVRDSSPDIENGQRYYLPDASSFRLNWKENDNSFRIDSVDVFREDDVTPFMRMDFDDDNMSIAPFLPVIVDFIKHPHRSFDVKRAVVLHQDEIDALDAEVVDESMSGEQLLEYRTKGAKNKSTRIDAGRPRKDPSRLRVNRGTGETEVGNFDPSDYIPTKTADEIFGEMEGYIKGVIEEIQPSLMITGLPGMGKSYRVEKQLKDASLHEGEDFVIFKGRVSAVAMYSFMYEHNGKIIIFDDCDSVLNDPNGINILKGALDSRDIRNITWSTKSKLFTEDGEEVPSTFQFNGRVIFISNWPEWKIDSALRSRSFVIDINLSKEEILKLMKDLLPIIGKGQKWALKATPKIRKQAMDALVEVSEENDKVQLNLRTLEKAMKIILMGHPRWKSMIATQARG
jgi:hypothetical protein